MVDGKVHGMNHTSTSRQSDRRAERGADRAAEILQHAEWYCRFGSDQKYTREPEQGDRDAAEVLKRLREEITRDAETGTAQ